MKVVLDTNISISGIFWKGSSNRVITNWKEGKFTLVTSLEAVSEITKTALFPTLKGGVFNMRFLGLKTIRLKCGVLNPDSF